MHCSARTDAEPRMQLCYMGYSQVRAREPALKARYTTYALAQAWTQNVGTVLTASIFRCRHMRPLSESKRVRPRLDEETSLLSAATHVPILA